MRLRPILLLAAAALVVFVLVAAEPFGTVRASVGNQTGGTATPTATGTTAATSTATVAATATATAAASAVAATATPTATAAAATATATATAAASAVAGTATPTATSPPLAAYPAPVLSASVARSGHSLVFRWSLISQKGVKGFNLYAAKHKLNAHLIKTHAKLSYHKTVAYRAGTRTLRVLFRNGGHLTVPIY